MTATDILERLNERADAFHHMLGDRESDTEQAMRDAAAEIARLREELARLSSRVAVDVPHPCFKEGVEAAAKWHEDQITEDADDEEADLGHRQCAAAIRSLPSPEAATPGWVEKADKC